MDFFVRMLLKHVVGTPRLIWDGMKKSNMGPVRVKNEDDFERLLARIDREAHRIADHWLLLKGLQESIKDYLSEMNESPAFWGLTIASHFDAVVFRLARIYDQHDASFGIKRFLLTVRAQPDLFSADSFRKRLHRLHGAQYSGQARELDPKDLEKDIKTVSAEDDPLVQQLHKLRNEQISHLDPRYVAATKLPLAHPRY